VSAPPPNQAHAPSFVGTTPSSVPRLKSARHLVLFPNNVITVKLSRQTMDAAESSGGSHQSRLFYVMDVSTKQQFLIDTGAEVSVFQHDHQTVHTVKVMIFRQPIPQQLLLTVRYQIFTINFGLRRSFPWINFHHRIRQPRHHRR
jgi:hypothetical protein